MALMKVSSGQNVSNDINVIIYIPAYGDPVKDEADRYRRLVCRPVHGHANAVSVHYGHVPHSLGNEGDPVDVLVMAPSRLLSGSVVRCRPIGLLRMTDESGADAKVLAVPADNLTPLHGKVSSFRDIAELQLAHFFEPCKDLEPGKWVKIDGWFDAEEAKQEILDSIKRYSHATNKPNF